MCFESQTSSIRNARSGRSYGLDVCVEMAQIESIIESRPGGKELLRSEGRLLRLLGCGRRYKIVSDDGKSIHIVKYTTNELDEIKRVIEYAELDVKKLSIQKVSDAIMRSFANDDMDLIPPKDNRYLSEASLHHLTGKIGLSIDNEEFDSNVTDLVEHIEQISWVVSQCHALTEDDEDSVDSNREYGDIEVDCLRLIRRFLEVDDNPPIQQITDSQVVPCLARYLNLDDDFRVEAASCLKNILAKGTNEHRKMVIDAEVIPSFSRLLGSSEDCLVKDAVLALVDIVTGGTKDQIESMVMAGGIPKLVDLLDSKHAVCVESSLRVLVIAAKDHLKKVVDAGVLPHIVRMMVSPDHVDMLANCSSLLRNIVGVNNPPIQRVIDSAVVPRV